MRGHFNRAVFLIALITSAQTVQSQDALGYGDVFGPGRTVGKDHDFARVMSTSLYSDGSLLVLDYGRHDLTRIGIDGAIKWRFGRSGGGPGEFQMPNAVVVLPDQSAIVFDLTRPMAVTRVSADGKFIEMMRMPFHINVRSALALPTGEIVIAGNTTDPRGSNVAVHMFSSRFDYLRSFGPLPQASREMIELAGVGWIANGWNGDVVFTRRYPYEVYRFDRTGRQVAMVVPPLAISRMEEETLKSQSGTRVTYTHNKAAVGPAPTKDLGNGLLLAGRNTTPFSMDVVNSAGQIVGSFKMAEGEYVSAIDFARKQFWLRAEEDDVPVFRIVSFGPRMR